MCIYSIYGYGKCKTESAVGIAIRGIANKDSVLFAQFLKDGTSSEIKFLEGKVDVITSNTTKLVLPKNKTQDDIVNINEFYKLIFNTINSKEYNLIILDEILVAVDMGMISLACLKLLLTTCEDKGCDVYMTGRVRSRDVRLAINDLSDCVTDARCVKHMFDTYCEGCKNSYPYYYTYCPDCGKQLIESRPCKVGRDF
jgi:cob(I)alamin adenosyltransferase